MTAEPQDWRASPNALEFLPEEIAGLAAGTLVVCCQCQWPRPAESRPRTCQTCNPDSNGHPPTNKTPGR